MRSVAQAAVLLLALTKIVDSFEVQYDESSSTTELDLLLDNVELEAIAALSGEQEVVEVVKGTQLAIAQHDVHLIFNCSTLISELTETGLAITWDARPTPGDEYRTLEGADGRISVTNGILSINPTLLGAESSDNGDYRCTVCNRENLCLERATSLFLIGSAPRLNESMGCTRESSILTCDMGMDIDLYTSTIEDPITLLIMNCNLQDEVLPTPSFTWRKDNSVVDMDSMDSILTFPSPSQLMVDLAHTPGMEEVVLEGGGQELCNILGVWECNVSNPFGSNSQSSTVASDGCQGGQYLTVGNSCECVCPQGYNLTQGEQSSCEDIDECATLAHNCSLDSEVCINSNGGFSCSCKPGFIYYGENGTCLDCGFRGQLANGSIEVGSEEAGQVVAMVTCDGGFDATRDNVTCTISKNSVKRDEVMCREQEDDSALIIIIIISIICITIGVIIIISCPVLILWIVWLIKYKKHTAYITKDTSSVPCLCCSTRKT